MTLTKKGMGRTTVTTTQSNKLMSKAMIKLLRNQSLKVSNTNNSINIQKIDQKVMSSKEVTSHIATTSGKECMSAVIHSQCQSLNISKSKYSSDTRTVNQEKIMTLPVKGMDCGTATISDKCTVDDMVVCGNSFRTTTTVAVNGKSETLVYSIKGKVGSYVCRICDKYFKHISSLKEHENIHNSTENKMQANLDRPHVCDICGLAFKKGYTLTVHYRMHTGHKPFACKFCSDMFSSSANRSVHMRTHTGCRPYVCNFCGFAFNQSHVLTEHKRLHTGERPYECGLCKMAFVSSGLLRKHTIRKHNKHA